LNFDGVTLPLNLTAIPEGLDTIKYTTISNLEKDVGVSFTDPTKNMVRERLGYW